MAGMLTRVARTAAVDGSGRGPGRFANGSADEVGAAGVGAVVPTGPPVDVTLAAGLVAAGLVAAGLVAAAEPVTAGEPAARPDPGA